MNRDTTSLPGDLYRISDDWISRLGRAGYATKGLVYALIGILAVQAASGGGGSATGTQGAILEIAEQPFGQVLLALTALGLFAYALWRFIEALLDPRGAGSDVKGLIKRIGYVISGLIYLGLAIWSAWILLGGRSGQSAGGGSSTRQWTAELLSHPYGQWLVGSVAAIIVGVGLYHFYRAYKVDFMDAYDTGAMSGTERSWARRIGRFGLSSRGIVFLLIGTFVLQAAIQSDPSEARGLEGALQSLLQQPYGPWLMALVALGLVAYGIFCVSRARYSRFSVH